MTRFALTLLATVWATSSLAQNLVTVRPEPKNDMWWLRADFHALDREVRGIPVAKIRADWCKATEFKRELFPKELLAENGADVMAEAKLSFSLDGSFDSSGTKQSALVGTYETCRGQKGHFFLIIDSDTRKVRFLQAKSDKNRFSALQKTRASEIAIFYCMECDIYSTVRWDRARKRFVVR